VAQVRDPEDRVGFVDGPNLYRYAGNNPLRWTDPTGYSRWSDEQCANLWKSIFEQANKLTHEIVKYDPTLDAEGGESWIPYGHLREIKDLQRGLKNRIASWMKYCFDPNDPCVQRRKTIPKWVDNLANYQPKVATPPRGEPPIIMIPLDLLLEILEALGLAAAA